MANAEDRPEAARGGRAALAGAAALTLIFAATVGPFLFSGNDQQALDQNRFHYPTILRLARTWPRVYLLRDFDAAMGPLYHYTLASLPRPVVGNLTAVRVVNGLFGLALLQLAYYYNRRLAGPAMGLALTLPLACCQWFLAVAIWLFTDNFTLLFLFFVLFDPAVVRRPSWLRASAYALGATLATAARQVHIWAALPAALASLLRTPLRRLVPARRLGIDWDDGVDEPLSWSYLVPAGLSAVGPLLVLAALVWAWGGLIPPQFRFHHEAHGIRFNPSALAFTLAVFGVQVVGFAPALGPHLARLLRLPATYLPALATAAYCIAFRTELTDTNSYSALRWGARMTPTVQGRSSLVLALATLGALGLTLLWRRARESDRGAFPVVFFLSLAAWALTHALNPMLYQRYYEGVAVGSLALLTAKYARDRPSDPWPPFAAVGPLALAAAHLALTTVRFLDLI